MKSLFLCLMMVSAAAFANDVLLIGDSHSCGSFGGDLAKAIKADVKCKVGSAPNFWVPQAAKDIAAYKTVVVALGTNSLLETTPDATYAALAKIVGAKKCYWVGPPNLNPKNAKGFPVARLTTMQKNLASFYTGLVKSAAPCTVIDSRPSTAGQVTLDGVHRGPAEGAKWASAVAAQVN